MSIFDLKLTEGEFIVIHESDVSKDEFEQFCQNNTNYSFTGCVGYGYDNPLKSFNGILCIGVSEGELLFTGMSSNETDWLQLSNSDALELVKPNCFEQQVL